VKKYNVNVHPHKGHQFKDSDGSTIVGESWGGVIARVIARRKRNNAPPGNPHEEVMEQACQSQPAACNESTSAGEIARQAHLKVASIKVRLLQWMTRVKTPVDHFVEPAEAARRADICASCPKALGLPEGCGSCRKASDEMRKGIIGPRLADGRLVHRGCDVFGSDLATQAWLELLAEDQSEAPANCWRKRSL
jgi:hypothetical protein